ncbi:hypothetical protein F2Q69_00023512 [Brassica cretica]|uniref:Uncharacterized protein n=1 Tax=Brassica cretica TaxID=69181 RepID=A0A8S9PZV9_BRACR|nr:hypothetical protein F2Q69_00023512 [Brassica cretica]
MASWIDQSKSPLGELDEPHPTHPMVSWIDQSNSPLGELDEPRPTHLMASWISLVQFSIRQIGSVPHHAISSPELPPLGLDQTVSCFIS